ncbi:MAG: amidohydrolase family protein [Proteobacteria bacterium]|nr:amidohydrolase family protein [Pseudomonadota bacterium]
MATEAGRAVAHLPIRPDWLARRREDILEPTLPIVDPHHHLWERPGNRYLLPDILADVGGGHNLRATVFIEAHSMYRDSGPGEWRALGETEFVTGIAAMSASGGYGPTRIAAGIVGRVDLTLGARAKAILERHIAVAGGRFRGVRHSSPYHADPVARGSSAQTSPGLLADAGFRAGFACLKPLGLSFDAWMYHTQLADLVDLARAFPEQPIVLDHIGGALGIGPYAGQRDAVFRDWSAGMRALAGCPNVHVKLGGLGMPMTGFDFGTRAEPPSSTELATAWKPYFDACVEAFGAQRCMVESNFPVDKGMFGYAVMWNAFKRWAAGCSAADKAALFSGTAARFYRWGLDA